MKTLLIIILGLVVGVAAYFVWSAFNAPRSLNPDLYPLYAGVTWSSVKSSTVEGAVGYEVVSNPILNISNIAASSTPFYNYYKNKLAQAGWTQDMSREAGGPGAEVSVYTKGNQFIIVSFTTIFHIKPTDAPEHCPCDLQFTLVSGETR